MTSSYDRRRQIVTKLTMPERGSFRLFGVQEAAHVVNEEVLSKACIHRENELKTHPMKPRQYIYNTGRKY